MNFPLPDLHRFLLDSIPARFENLAPDEFGAFLRYLFQLDGYEVLPVVTSADLGYHMQGVKDGASLVILTVLTKAQAAVEIEEVKKALQARELYKADQVWIITNSTFTPEARGLADLSDVELWDWNALYEGICQLFFEGKSHLEHPVRQPDNEVIHEEESGLKLKAKWSPVEGLDATWYNLSLQISNPTDRNIYLHLELPAFIDTKKTQVFADQWGTDDFVSGLLYAGATVKTNAQFKVSKLGERPPGGHVVLTCHERRDTPVTFHLHTRLRGEACFVVTYCYSRDSMEYRIMTRYRNEVLNRYFFGKMLIQLYYGVSPGVVALAGKYKIADAILRFIAARVVKRFI